MPDIKSIIFRQDNAGCYHSAATLLGLQQLACQQNVALRMDFSDPQGGKDPCDRKAATVKSHMRTFLNSGNDIETVEQMKIAIESGGRVRGVRVKLCALDYQHKHGPKPRWEGVSFVNNVTYEKKGMRVWRAYGIGKGKFLPWSDFQDLRARNNGRSTDNVRTDCGFDRSNFRLAGHVDRSKFNRIENETNLRFLLFSFSCYLSSRCEMYCGTWYEILVTCN